MVTIGFSPHRVEILPFARKQMEAHQVIIMEEPPSEDFNRMLQGQVSIHDCVLRLDSAFPKFQERMYLLIRELYRSGKRIFQVEPYLERLLQIHENFTRGKTREAVMKTAGLREVYMAEKRASGALISFYASSMKDSFDTVVQAVKVFARADAQRFDLRARLRAKAIASLVTSDESMYIEAGYMHYPLLRYLGQELGNPRSIAVVFLLAPVIKQLKGKRRNLGPGDVLTLHYALHNGKEHDLADLLAARSLIYTKLIQKEELIPGVSEAPHSENEVKVERLVEHLQYHDCRELFQRIKKAKHEHALRFVESYVEEKKRTGM
jgi:hypothetical protein